MAITSANFTNLKRWPLSPGRWGFRATFTGPTSYAAAGEPLTAALCLAALGLSRVETIQCSAISGNASQNSSEMVFDHTPSAGVHLGKFRIYEETGAAQANTAAEVAATANYGSFSAVLTGHGS